MKWFKTRRRSHQREIMDEVALPEKELQKTLRNLDRVNYLLGGYRITLKGIEKILGSTCFAGPLRLVDAGCGNGSMLRTVADMARKRGLQMKLIGIDASPNTIAVARKESEEYPEIIFRTADITEVKLEEEQADIIICTLTLHHFDDGKVQALMKDFSSSAHMGVVINDLQRSLCAYYLFKLFCVFFIHDKIARKDGLTSILRGFKKRDLQQYGKNLPVRKQLISWRWAFRYQWIILK